MKISDWFRNLFSRKNQLIPLSDKVESNSYSFEKEYAASVLARDLGIKQAEDSANSKNKGWSDLAYGYLLAYTKAHPEFMIEEIRTSSAGLIPEPPSNRAWGSIAVRAAKEGIISRKGFQSVKNVKAHRTPATLWKVN